jgi:hypothetical protein
MLDNSAVYNSLPLFQELQPDSTSDLSKLESLLTTLGMAGMNERIGFVRLHRHFTVSDGKLPVWQVKGSQLVSSVREVRPDIDLPIVWRISQAGNLIPLEFMAVETLDPNVVESLVEIPKTTEFLRLSNAMKNIAVGDSFGISLMPILMAYASGGRMVERSDRSNRSSVLSPAIGTLLDGVPSLWVFRGGSPTILATCHGKDSC